MSASYEKPSTHHLPKGIALFTSACRYWPLFIQPFPLSFGRFSLWLKCSREPLVQILSFRCHTCTHTRHWVCEGLSKRNHSCSSLLHEELVCDLVQRSLIKRSTLYVRMSVLKRIEHKPRQHGASEPFYGSRAYIVMKYFMELMTHFTIIETIPPYFCEKKIGI